VHVAVTLLFARPGVAVDRRVDGELLVADAEETVLKALRTLLERREDQEHVAEVRVDSALYDDLMMDSLEVAEFSAELEDFLGTDPYSAGLMPETVGEVIAFYSR
jgi:acyl carrier protein